MYVFILKLYNVSSELFIIIKSFSFLLFGDYEILDKLYELYHKYAPILFFNDTIIIIICIISIICITNSIILISINFNICIKMCCKNFHNTEQYSLQ